MPWVAPNERAEAGDIHYWDLVKGQHASPAYVHGQDAWMISTVYDQVLQAFVPEAGESAPQLGGLKASDICIRVVSLVPIAGLWWQCDRSEVAFIDVDTDPTFSGTPSWFYIDDNGGLHCAEARFDELFHVPGSPVGLVLAEEGVQAVTPR